MNRRGFVFALGLLAGCTTRIPGEDIVDSPPRVEDIPTVESSRSNTPAAATPTPEPTPEPTAEPTPEPTPEPTEEPPVERTRTPTEAEKIGAERLARAERELTQIVNLFVGSYGSEITDVTATSTGILKAEYRIQRELASAQKAYVEASKRAANPEQKVAAERMSACWQFLRQMVRTQLAVVRGYEHLTAARDAFSATDASAGRDAVESLGTERSRAANHYEETLSSSTAEDVAVIEAITVAEYESKVAQLGADIDTYRDLDDTLRTFADGVRWLESAKAEFYRDDRNVPLAREHADEAERLLKQTRNELNGMIGSAGATSLTQTMRTLRSVAIDKIKEAQAIEI